jgi:hypothetical protein
LTAAEMGFKELEGGRNGWSKMALRRYMELWKASLLVSGVLPTIAHLIVDDVDVKFSARQFRDSRGPGDALYYVSAAILPRWNV